MPLLADLVVRLTGDTQSATQALRDADQAIERTTTQGSANLGVLNTLITRMGNEALPGLGSGAMLASRSLDALGQSGISAAGQLAIAGAGLGALGLALGGLSFAAFDTGITKLHLLAQETGLTEQQISGLQTAMAASGGSADRMAVGLAQAQRQLEVMQQGMDTGKAVSNNFTKALDDLGIKAYTLDGQVRPLSQLLPEIMNRFQGMAAAAGDSSQKVNLAGIAQELFGRSGYAMLPVLEAGAAGMNHFTESAIQMGIASQQEMQRWGQWQVTSAQLAQSFQGAEMALGSGLEPAVRSIAGTVTDAATAFAKLPGPVQEAVVAFPLLASGALLAGSAAAKLVTTITPMVDVLSGYTAASRLAAAADLQTAAAEEAAAAAAAALEKAQATATAQIAAQGLASSSAAPQILAMATADEEAALAAAQLAVSESAAEGASIAVGTSFAAMAGPIGLAVAGVGILVGGFFALKGALDQSTSSEDAATKATQAHVTAIEAESNALARSGASDQQQLALDIGKRAEAINQENAYADAIRARQAALAEALRQRDQETLRTGMAPPQPEGPDKALDDLTQRYNAQVKAVSDYDTKIAGLQQDQQATANGQAEIAKQTDAAALALGGGTVALAGNADALTKLQSIVQSVSKSTDELTAFQQEQALAATYATSSADEQAKTDRTLADAKKNGSEATKAYAADQDKLNQIYKTLGPAAADAAVKTDLLAAAQKAEGASTAARVALTGALSAGMGQEALAAETTARAHDQLAQVVARGSRSAQDRAAVEAEFAQALAMSRAPIMDQIAGYLMLRDAQQNGNADEKAYAQGVLDSLTGINQLGAATAEATLHTAELAGAWTDASANGGDFQKELGVIRDELKGTADDAQKAKDQILGLLSQPGKDELGLQAQISAADAQVKAWGATIANSSPIDQRIAALQKQLDQEQQNGASTSTLAKTQADLNAQLAELHRTGADAEGQAVVAGQHHIDMLQLQIDALKGQKDALTAARVATEDQAKAETSTAGTVAQLRDLYRTAAPQIVASNDTINTSLDTTDSKLQAIIGHAQGATSALAGMGSASTAGGLGGNPFAAAANVASGAVSQSQGRFSYPVEALSAPGMAAGMTTQPFGPTNETAEPAYGGYTHFHEGIDYGMPEGMAVRAVGAGRVIAAGYGVVSPGQGNSVVIDLGGGFTSIESHLSKIEVNTGDQVKQGQEVGLSGNTGTATTGPHLHFQLMLNGQPVDPAQYLGGTPIQVPVQFTAGTGSAAAAGGSVMVNGVPIPVALLAAIQAHESTLPLPSPGSPQPMFGIAPGSPESVGTGTYTSGGSAAGSAGQGVPTGYTRQSLFPSVSAGIQGFYDVIKNIPGALDALQRGDIAGFMRIITPAYAGNPEDAATFESQVLAAYQANPNASFAGMAGNVSLGTGATGPGAPSGGYGTPGQLPVPSPEGTPLTDEQRQAGVAEATRKAADAQRELNSLQGKGHDEFATVTRDQITALDAERDRLKGIAEDDYGKLRDANQALAGDYASGRDDMIKSDQAVATAAENDARAAGTAYSDAAAKADAAWTAFLANLTQNAANTREAIQSLRDASTAITSFYGGEPSTGEQGAVTPEQLVAAQQALTQARQTALPALTEVTRAENELSQALLKQNIVRNDPTATDAARTSAQNAVNSARAQLKAAQDDYAPFVATVTEAQATLTRAQQAQTQQRQQLDHLDVDSAAATARARIAEEGSLTAAQTEAVNARIAQMQKEGASALQIAQTTADMRRNFIEGNKAAGQSEVSALQAQGDRELANYRTHQSQIATLNAGIAQKRQELAAAMDAGNTDEVNTINAQIAALIALRDTLVNATPDEIAAIDAVIKKLGEQATAHDNVTSSAQAQAAAEQRAAQQGASSGGGGGGGGGGASGNLGPGTYGLGAQNPPILQYEFTGAPAGAPPPGSKPESAGPGGYYGGYGNLFNYASYQSGNAAAAALYFQAMEYDQQNQGPNENTTIVIIGDEVIARSVDRYYGRRNTSRVIGRN